MLLLELLGVLNYLAASVTERLQGATPPHWRIHVRVKCIWYIGIIKLPHGCHRAVHVPNAHVPNVHVPFTGYSPR